MSVQLAVAPIAWSNSDLPQLGGDTPKRATVRVSGAELLCAGGFGSRRRWGSPR